MSRGLTLALWASLLASLGCGGPTRDPARCRRSCPALGVTEPGRCEALCEGDCGELAATYGMAEERCAQLQSGALAPRGETASSGRGAGPVDGTERCGDFVAFLFECGIGRPPRDPTLDRATQLNNDLIVMQGVADRCRARRRPYDPQLMACWDGAGGDCARYEACASGVVERRGE